VSAAELTATEVRLLAALKALVSRVLAEGLSSDSRPALDAALAVLAATEPAAIPVGEVSSSDFGAFMDEVRK